MMVRHDVSEEKKNLIFVFYPFSLYFKKDIFLPIFDEYIWFSPKHM